MVGTLTPPVPQVLARSNLLSAPCADGLSGYTGFVDVMDILRCGRRRWQRGAWPCAQSNKSLPPQRGRASGRRALLSALAGGSRGEPALHKAGMALEQRAVGQLPPGDDGALISEADVQSTLWDVSSQLPPPPPMLACRTPSVPVARRIGQLPPLLRQGCPRRPSRPAPPPPPPRWRAGGGPWLPRAPDPGPARPPPRGHLLGPARGGQHKHQRLRRGVRGAWGGPRRGHHGL